MSHPQEAAWLRGDGSEDKVTEDLLDQTIAFWQPRYERELTEEDVRQIAENLVGFFRTLLRCRTTTAPSITLEDEREAA